MSDYRRADEVWEEDEVDEDDAKTLVARNPLRDPADEQEASAPAQAGERGPELAREAGARDSVISVRDSEIELVGDDGVPAGAGAGPTRSPEPAEPTAEAGPDATLRPSFEVLRDSEVDRLRADAADPAPATEVPALAAHAASVSKAAVSKTNAAPEDEPSISVTDLEVIEESSIAIADQETDAASALSEKAPPASAGESTPVVVRPRSARNEATERVSTLPRTHPFANSIAPTAAPKSVPPAAPGASAWSLGLVAVVFLVLGGALARLQDRTRTADGEVATPPTQVVAAARVAEPNEPAPEAERAGTAEQAAELSPSEAVATTHEAAEPQPAEEVAPTLVSAESSAAAPRRSVRDQGAREASPVPARRERRRAQAPEGEVPAQPSREAVVAVMDAMRSELEKCTGGRRGIAEVSVTVRPEGRVSYAVVDGSFAGSPEGTCMAQALRQAKFPAFSDPMLRVKYPFQF